MTSWSETLPELRSGEWTRRGGSSVLGDPVTEQLMDALATTTREAAQAQGYAVGWAQGRREAAAAAEVAAADERARAEAADVRRDGEHRAALDALATALDEARAAYDALVADLLERAADVAADLTGALVAQAVSADPVAVTVGRALDAVTALAADGSSPVRVRVWPGAVVATRAADGPLGPDAAVVADPALHPGDAVVETDVAVVDARLSLALPRVVAALRGLPAADA